MRRIMRRVFLGGACSIAAACGGAGGGAGTAPLEVRMLEAPAAGGSGQPDLAAGPGGEVVLSWLEPGDGGASSLQYATLRDGAWSAAGTVVRGENLFVNWADVPSIVPITAELWAAHWLELVEGSFGAYDVAAAVSRDAGATWSEPRLLNDDDTETEHGFATLFAWGDGVGAVWLDGRELAEWSFDEPEALLGVSLRYARLTPEGEIVERGIVDELVCDCCQTDVAMTATGPIVIYRDRTPAEIRDVVVRRHDGGGWRDAVGLGEEGWHLEGCPVNGPAIAARADDVAAAWFTAAGGVARVRFARSADGGAAFGPAVDIDAEGAFGQVDVLLLDTGTAVVSWWRRAPGGTALAMRTIARDGALGPIHTIVEKAVAQPLDVPEMTLAGDALLVTWTDEGDGGRVRTAAVRNLR